MATTFSQSYSGLIINQNIAPESTSDWLAIGTAVYQEFRLPLNVKRGIYTPPLTGVQVRCKVTSLTAQVDMTLETRSFGGAWTRLTYGTAAGAPVVDNEVWLTWMFDEPVDVTSREEDEFRVRLAAPSGVTGVWYSVPNPLADVGGVKAYAADGSTPLLDTSREISFNFRILGAVADSGTDFLGNQYRSVVVRKSIDQADPTSPRDSYWLSAPQPSKFAVVSQYYDVGDLDDPVVVDGIVIDPVTPGVWVHAYYCNDGDPGTTDEEWEERIWTPIPRAYRALRRDTFIFPKPISARYIKLEYSHLQARSYAVGGFQKPIEYRKHPKWVLDYFLLAAEQATGDDQFVARSVNVTYDAYDLAYRYYQDDLGTSPDAPAPLTPEDEAKTKAFYSTRDDKSDIIDSQTRAQINTILTPFLYDARTRTVARSLLGESVVLNTTTSGDPVESIASGGPVSNAVSSLDREAVVFEQSFPVMFFYLPCRHRYRHVSATLAQDRAYFVGMREVAFIRERYRAESDLPMYVETLGDHGNSERNDFIAPRAPKFVLPSQYGDLTVSHPTPAVVPAPTLHTTDA
jgi:hypothetical protein